MKNVFILFFAGFIQFAHAAQVFLEVTMPDGEFKTYNVRADLVKVPIITKNWNCCAQRRNGDIYVLQCEKGSEFVQTNLGCNDSIAQVAGHAAFLSIGTGKKTAQLVLKCGNF